jgi:lysophospholipid acyltransferase (LPLAT)-like uncharacterized protein
MLKRLLSKAWAQEVLAFVIMIYIELVRRSVRWEVRGAEIPRKIWDERMPVLGTVWHGRVLMALHGWREQQDRMLALASRSREGEIGRRLARWYKVGVVRGSSRNAAKPGKTKGGEAAYRAMVEHLLAGGCGVVTPDGPRGPRMRAAYGAVRMARESGVPILPFTWSTKRKHVLHNAWDKHCLPQFFSSGVIIFGELIHVAKDAGPAEIEEARLLLETRMNEITREADEAAGGEIVECDPEPRPGTAPAGDAA